MTIIIKELLLSGGGVKGIVYCGFLKGLEDLEKWEIIQLDIKLIKGISIGSVFGLMMIIGYTYEELKKILINKNFKKLKKMKLSNIINGYGLDNGEKLIEWIEELMEKKECSKIITMKELYEKYNKELQIVVTDLKKVNQLTIDKTSDLKVIDCIRQAITIPFIFTLKGNYIDGAVLNNFPWEYNDMRYGILLKNEKFDYTEIKSLIDYIKILYKLLRESIKQKHDLNYKNVLLINCNINIINFDMNKKNKLQLIEQGYKCTLEYFFNLNKNFK